MKAVRQITVCSIDGGEQIGTLERGDTVWVLNADESGTYIAYIVGRIAPEYAMYLVNEAEWAEQVSAKEKLLGFVAAQVGCLYVLGAQGQEMTPALIRKLEHVAEKDYQRAMAQYNKHVAAGQTLVAYDCSGLIVKHLLDEKLIGGDLTANGLYFNACEPIEKDALCGGDIVFKKYATQNRMYHVGVYMGDGTVVHAKGRDDGVVRESLGKAGWNRFGRLKCLNPDMAPVYTRLLKVTGRPYMNGDDVCAVQRALADAGFSPGEADASYGPKTEKAVRAYQAANSLTEDGIVGPKTWEKLIG